MVDQATPKDLNQPFEDFVEQKDSYRNYLLDFQCQYLSQVTKNNLEQFASF